MKIDSDNFQEDAMLVSRPVRMMEEGVLQISEKANFVLVFENAPI